MEARQEGQMEIGTSDNRHHKKRQPLPSQPQHCLAGPFWVMCRAGAWVWERAAGDGVESGLGNAGREQAGAVRIPKQKKRRKPNAGGPFVEALFARCCRFARPDFKLPTCFFGDPSSLRLPRPDKQGPGTLFRSIDGGSWARPASIDPRCRSISNYSGQPMHF